MKKLISLKAARKILKADKPDGMSDTKIRQLIKKDPTFPAYLIGGEYMVDVNALDEWIEDKRVNVAPPNFKRQAEKTKRGRPEKGHNEQSKLKLITPGWNGHPLASG